MRLRLAELMAAHEPPLTTAYALHKAARGNLSMTNAHRLVNAKGKPVALELATLAVLCDLFGVTPGELLEHEPKPLRPKRVA